jgi:hypothetical protein
MSIPEDFPRFQVPGQEKEMESLRGLFWLHYPGSGPKSTLWDEWLSGPGFGLPWKLMVQPPRCVKNGELCCLREL